MFASDLASSTLSRRRHASSSESRYYYSVSSCSAEVDSVSELPLAVHPNLARYSALGRTTGREWVDFPT